MNKGREFKGLAAGAHYNKWGALFGFTPQFYCNGVGKLSYQTPVTVLDLGCGPGSLSFAFAEKAPDGSSIYGIDISDDQLNYARQHTEGYGSKIEFIKCSMDALTFPDNHFDIVMTSMALHETPPQVRRDAIKEVSKVLKPGGIFILVDWCKPKLGLWGAIWLPMVYFKSDAYKKDNWNNAYKEICEKQDLQTVEDYYINTIARRQVFKKK